MTELRLTFVPGKYRVLMETGQVIEVHGADDGYLRGEIVQHMGKDSKIVGVACLRRPKWIPKWMDGVDVDGG